MKRIIVITLITLGFLFSILMSFLLYRNSFFGLFTIMIVLYIICFISIIGLSKYRTYMESRIIDPKRNYKRNYKRIFLGIQNSETADEDTLDLRGYSRNFFVDSLLVQRYYSFLDLEGTIIIFTGAGKHYVKDKWICPLDYPLLHPVTLMENRIKPHNYLMFNPLIGLLYLWMLLFGTKRTDVNCFEEEAKTIIEFCKERNVNIEII